jgi:hypothetical protein
MEARKSLRDCAPRSSFFFNPSRDIQMINKLKIFGWTVYAFVVNAWIEWRNDRLEKSRRRWTAHKIDGGGVVPLGKVSQEKAITKVSQFGSVRFVDTEVACIMYSDKNQ